MKNKLINYLLLFCIIIVSCKKQETTIPPSLAEFTASSATASYFIQNDPNSSFKIPVGFSTPSGSDRKITYTVTSPTGASAGVQYNITSSGSILIPAGKTVDSIVIKGLFAGYPTGRRDSLVFKITGGDGSPATYSNTFYLIMQKFCTVNLSALLGNYTRTNELFGTSAYGPYTTSISSATSTGLNKGRIVVQNIWDSGWGPIEFDLDWSDPANFKVIVVPKTSGIADGGTISSTYAGMQVAVKAFTGQDGTFSSCDGTLTLKMQLGITGQGYFGSLYTVTMVR